MGFNISLLVLGVYRVLYSSLYHMDANQNTRLSYKTSKGGFQNTFCLGSFLKLLEYMK